MTETQNVIRFRRLTPRARLPTRSHSTDAGLDLYSIGKVSVGLDETIRIPIGLAVEIPPGHVGLILGRSGLSSRGLLVQPGVIDSGYRGELQVILYNGSGQDVSERALPNRIAQLLIMPIATPSPVEVDSLDETDRGSGGFGSTGSD